MLFSKVKCPSVFGQQILLICADIEFDISTPKQENASQLPEDDLALALSVAQPAEGNLQTRNTDETTQIRNNIMTENRDSEATPTRDDNMTRQLQVAEARAAHLDSELQRLMQDFEKLRY